MKKIIYLWFFSFKSMIMNKDWINKIWYDIIWYHFISYLLYDISIMWHIYHMIHYMIIISYHITWSIMEDKKIISMRQIMKDLVNKQKKWWYFKRIMDDKKKMGLGRIMEDKKIIFMRRIMEDLVNKQKKW